MILATRTGSQEVRMSEFGSSVIPSWGRGLLSSAGIAITEDAVVGLPAVACAVQSVADICSALSMIIYQDVKGQRQRAATSWQWGLLHDSFDLFYDIHVSLETSQNAFIEKVKSGRRVVQLNVLDPMRMSCRRIGGQKTFEYYDTNGKRQTLTDAEILHIKGYSPTPGSLVGVPRLTLYRDPLGAYLAMQQFEGDYFRNSAKSPTVLRFPTGVGKAQAEQWADSWNASHAGPGNQFKTGVIGQGGEIQQLPISMQDAMFAQAKEFSIADIARIFRWPHDFLELDPKSPSRLSDEQRSIHVLRYFVFPRLRRIESALAADSDLFSGSSFFPEFLTDSFLRADTATRYTAYKDAIQAGWMTQNEARAKENMPPSDDPRADELQMTPVGGAPNAPKPPADGDSIPDSPIPGTD